VLELEHTDNNDDDDDNGGGGTGKYVHVTITKVDRVA